MLHISADINSHLSKNHLYVIRDRSEVESKTVVKKY